MKIFWFWSRWVIANRHLHKTKVLGKPHWGNGQKKCVVSCCSRSNHVPRRVASGQESSRHQSVTTAVVYTELVTQPMVRIRSPALPPLSPHFRRLLCNTWSTSYILKWWCDPLLISPLCFMQHWLGSTFVEVQVKIIARQDLIIFLWTKVPDSVTLGDWVFN